MHAVIITWKQVAHTLSEVSAMLTCRIILQVKVDLVTWHFSHLYWFSPCSITFFWQVLPPSTASPQDLYRALSLLKV